MYPPYGSDLSRCHYHLFGPLKEALGGQRFDDDAGVEEFVRNWQQTQSASFFEKGIKNCQFYGINVFLNQEIM